MFSLHSDDSRKEKDWLLSFALLTLQPHSDFELSSLQTIFVSREVAAGDMSGMTRAATVWPAASEQQCLALAALWLLCCGLLDPTLHPLLSTSQHSFNDTVSSPTNHSNCCSSVPQFSRKPASSDQHLSSEEIWKPTGQPGWPRRHQ